MDKVQVIMYTRNSEEVKVDIPIDLYSQVCNEIKGESSREELASDFEGVVRERFPKLHQYLLEYLKLTAWYEQYPSATHYALLSDWFDAKEKVYNVRFEQVYIHKDNPRWADEIVALGRMVWKKFPPLQSLQEFIERQEGCCCVVEVITADNEFAGFAVTLYLRTRKGEIYDYHARYISMIAIMPLFRNQGLGERLLRHVSIASDSPVIVTSNPFVSEVGNKQGMRTCYEKNGFVRMPMGWTDDELNEYDVFVKGYMHMEAWAAISERVQEIWYDFEMI